MNNSRNSPELKMEGKQLMGRPRRRWEDEVKDDARTILYMRWWKSAAFDKNEWRKKLREATCMDTVLSVGWIFFKFCFIQLSSCLIPQTTDTISNGKYYYLGHF